MDLKNVIISGKLIEKKEFEKKDKTGKVYILTYFDGSRFMKNIMVSQATYERMVVDKDITVMCNVTNYVKDGQEKTYITEITE